MGNDRHHRTGSAPEEDRHELSQRRAAEARGEAADPYLSPSRKKEQIRELEELGVRVGRRMGSRFPGVKEVGLDVALDGKVRPWILEVNTRPDPYIFRTLKDKEIFRRIYRYAKAYKRL
ncbi:YheC/YheD family protein [Paenibacillus sp. CC-CFT747]|nr:YheC/YheD family protein [Paenibacillus sp. CC-CFT747]